MKDFSINQKARINGVYLNLESIDMMCIIECKSFDELRKFVKECVQLNVSDNEFARLESLGLSKAKRELFEMYKDSLVAREEALRDRGLIVKNILERCGVPSEESNGFVLAFAIGGYEAIKQKLQHEYPDKYVEMTRVAHEYIGTERDQMKSVSYDEMVQVREAVLKNHDTILVANGRFYDVRDKMHDENNPESKKYDFYKQERQLDFCYRNGKYVRYHTLLDKKTMEDIGTFVKEHLKGKSREEIKEAVKNELKKYVEASINFINEYNKTHKINGKGIITSIDLFNEIISFDEPYRNMWEKLHGIETKDLVEVFQYALEKKPEGVTYVYNEPFLENPKRREVVLKQLTEINKCSAELAKNNPNLPSKLIDTIGTQMHIEMSQEMEEVTKCFEDLKALQKDGISTQITELDMCLPEHLMFDDKGKARNEKELLEIINLRTSKNGKTFKSMVEFKEWRMKELSLAIEKSGIELDGVSYWSISDTMDHNLQRTNEKTVSNHLPREIATTRYAGLYSDFEERVMEK